MIYYSKEYVSFTGYVLLIFSIIGAIYIIKEHKAYSIPIFFGFFYFLTLSKVPLHWERWALPMYITPLILAGFGIQITYEKFFRQNKNILINSFISLLIFIPLLNMVQQSLVIVIKFTFKDIRYISYQYCLRSNITPDNSIYEGYTPYAPNAPRDARDFFDSYINEGYMLDKKYVIVSSKIYDRYFDENERYKHEVSIYKDIFSLPLVKEFKPTFIPHYDFGSGEIKSIINGFQFLNYYLRNKNNCLTGPVIKIYYYFSKSVYPR